MIRETIYGFIAAEKTTYPVRLLCRVLAGQHLSVLRLAPPRQPAISDERHR